MLSYEVASRVFQQQLLNWVFFIFKVTQKICMEYYYFLGKSPELEFTARFSVTALPTGSEDSLGRWTRAALIPKRILNFFYEKSC